ncbi:MAG: prenyltransferase [Deltaproteobacteria bacterium]|jgi:1,4-dihydroxy-2-naphthoate octaprenyltransferase|nr:prenyltransferase [Deltaproteobacteria bacterium]
MSLRQYVAASRLPFVSASILPLVFIVFWSWNYSSEFSWVAAVLAFFGVLFLHLGANTVNDYFDWDGTDAVNRHATPLSGGSRKAVEKFFGKKTFLVLTLLFFFTAVVLGIILFFLQRKLVLLFGLAGGLCGVLYSVRPFSFQERGLGELLIFLAFGPLLTCGAGYAVTGTIGWDVVLLGVPNGAIVTNILLINEFPDYEADSTTSKKNLVVRLGLKASRLIYISLYFIFFLSIGLLYLYDLLSVWNFLVFGLVPLAFHSISLLWKRYSKPQAVLPAQVGTVIFQIVAMAIMIFIQIFQKTV